MPRHIQAKPNKLTPCPKCGNDTHFAAHSRQIAEDCCETWIVCKCGFDPTREDWGYGYRMENVWGGTGDQNVATAMHCWNDAMEKMPANNG